MILCQSNRLPFSVGKSAAFFVVVGWREELLNDSEMFMSFCWVFITTIKYVKQQKKQQQKKENVPNELALNRLGWPQSEHNTASAQ